MGTKYFVVEVYRYKESGNWEYRAVGSYNSVYDAKQAFHTRKAAITKSTNDFVMVKAFDMYGNDIIKPDFDNTYVEPEPEPNIEEE